MAARSTAFYRIRVGKNNNNNQLMLDDSMHMARASFLSHACYRCNPRPVRGTGSTLKHETYECAIDMKIASYFIISVGDGEPSIQSHCLRRLPLIIVPQFVDCNHGEWGCDINAIETSYEMHELKI